MCFIRVVDKREQLANKQGQLGHKGWRDYGSKAVSSRRELLRFLLKKSVVETFN